jgi:CubicO group peptidase (beta-lactamase class C family)
MRLIARLGAAVVASLIGTCLAPGVARAQIPANLETEVEGIRKKYNLVSLAVAVVVDGKTQSVVATGFRKAGSPEKVTPGDKFHHGSCTKSMTATLAGMLVDDGKLTWDTTIGQIFPELSKDIRPEYRKVTLKHLLSHHAGLSDSTFPAGSPDYRTSKKSLREQRLEYVRLALREASIAIPGTKFLYSNRGYVIAGAMIERVMNDSWENLLRKRLFEPLGMKTAGFGWMASKRMVDQPWPHETVNGRAVPIAPGVGADNPLVIGPAGTVHCSLADLAKFVTFHIDGMAGGKQLLKPETLKTLHTPPFDGEYALGWMVVNRDWAGGTTLTHAGSNNMNYTLIWFGLARKVGVIVSTNQAGDRAHAACEELTTLIIQKLTAQASPQTNPHDSPNCLTARNVY